MDNPFGSAMADLVVVDSARLSGRDFADARGAGVARRVRTRRTVRAAGVGGVSAVAAGALAFGATHLPRPGGIVAPATSGECTPTALVDIDAMWTHTADPRAHVIDASESFDVETWYLYDDNLEMVVLKMVPTDAGLEVTYADGQHALLAHYQPDGFVSHAPNSRYYFFEAPGGGYVTFDAIDDVHQVGWESFMTAARSGIETLPDVAPPFDWQWTGCGRGTQGAPPSPTAPVRPNTSTNPGPSLAAGPEVITSPFECGFEFPTESYGTGDLWIDSLRWISAADAEAAVRSSFADQEDPNLFIPQSPVPVVNVHFASAQVAANGGGLVSVSGTGTPDGSVLEDAVPDGTQVAMLASEGLGFVGVKDGRVVATWPALYGSEIPAWQLWLNSMAPDGSQSIYLLDPDLSLYSCTADGADFSSLEYIAVAGLVAKHADGTVDEAIYAWLPVDAP